MTNNANDRFYLWDESQLMAIFDGTGTTRISEFVYVATDQPLARITGTPSQGDTVHFYAQDARGNVFAQFQGTTIEQTLTYEPWGTSGLAHTIADTTQPLRWKGLLWENGVTSLYYMRARWYDPVTRRFISPDPMGLASGINQYAFAGGDPINGVDPTGLKDCMYIGDDEYDPDEPCVGGDLPPGDEDDSQQQASPTCTLETPVSECSQQTQDEAAAVISLDWAGYLGIGGDFGVTAVLTTNDLMLYNNFGAGAGIDTGPSLMVGWTNNAQVIPGVSTTISGGNVLAGSYTFNESGSAYMVGVQAGAGAHVATTYGVPTFGLELFMRRLENSARQYLQNFFNSAWFDGCQMFGC